MNRNQAIATVAGLLLGLLLVACGQPATPEGASTPAGGSPAVKTRPAWEDDWDRTLAAARKEGTVSVYVSTGGDWVAAIAEVMSKRYGITVETVVARVAELNERIMREQRSRVYHVDVVRDGIVVSETLIPENMLEPLDKALMLPEVIDPKVWWRGGLTYLDEDTKTNFAHQEYVNQGIAFNKDMVKPGEIKSWNDLLDPKWKGKIAISDPTTGGTGQSLSMMVAYKIMGWDYLNRLVKQEPVPSRDNRLMTEWVARGKYPLLIAPPPTAIEFINAGTPIDYAIVAEGTYLTVGGGYLSLLKTSPHPNAARVFINFFLTREGQTIYSRASGYQSSRVDVPTDHLMPSFVRQPGIKYPSALEKEYRLKEAELRDGIVKLFQSLAK
ncbi:MAG: extracellular solute-binding protein [Chloroflexi bacterium]|nr:extracellular solute-binding protein [Chloroflexota bacterium]